MRKIEWATPKLEVLSTSKTANNGQLAPDTFHDALSGTASFPSLTDTSTS